MNRHFDVVVDHDVCVGNAMCRAVAGRTFVADASGQSVVADSDTEPVEAILRAAEDCPTGAISVTDRETGESLL